MGSLTHWKKMVNTDYLGAYSLQGTADSIILTIKDVKREKVTAPGGVVDDCIVARFEETQKNGVVVKPMVLNATNCKTISAMYGTPFIEEWIGKKVEIVVAQTKYQRDLVDCLRIKNKIPEVPVYKCSVCGKEIDELTYNGSMKKYGKAYCSKQCLDKDAAETAQTTTEETNNNN